MSRSPTTTHVIRTGSTRTPMPSTARGIAIVAQLATSWGVRDDPYGKTVWFDVAG